MPREVAMAWGVKRLGRGGVRPRLERDFPHGEAPQRTLQKDSMLAAASDFAARGLRTIRHLSGSIALKRHCLAVNLTVKVWGAPKNGRLFSRLDVPETIEWE